MRAAIYVRQSLDRSGEGAAVARQEVECRELACRNGWDVARVYSDNDRSASSGKPRPAWTELLRDLADGHYDVLLCWHTDRLYRRLRDLVDLVELAERRALRISSVRAAELDLGTPAGRMLAGMLGSAARYEAEQKGARQVAANRARAARGIVRWTRRPFGFDQAEGHVVVVESEAEELRRAAGRVLAGATTASVVRDLNDRGVNTSTGGAWSVTSLRRALLNPRTAGRAVSLGQDYGPSVSPAIFDPETADRVRAVLTSPARRTTTETGIRYLLSGIAICGTCGGTMYASPAQTPSGRRWMIYRCHTTHLARRLDLVDSVVEGAVIARLSQPDAGALFAGDSTAEVETIRSRLVELRERRDGLAGLLADGLLTPTATREQATRLASMIGETEAVLARATASTPVTALVHADDVAAAWSVLPLTSRRAVVRVLLSVTIKRAGRGARFAPEQVQLDWH